MSSFEPEKLIMVYFPMRNMPYTLFFDLYPEKYLPIDGRSNGSEKFWGINEIKLFQMVSSNTWLL